jgi:HEAT repeat protein
MLEELRDQVAVIREAAARVAKQMGAEVPYKVSGWRQAGKVVIRLLFQLGALPPRSGGWLWWVACVPPLL